MEKYSITTQIHNSEELKEQFHSFLSTIEKNFESFFGEFTFSFENIISKSRLDVK